MPMTAKLEHAFSVLSGLAPERQDELADALVGTALPTIQYSAEQLTGIDEAIASADRGEFASDSQVKTTLAKFRAV